MVKYVESSEAVASILGFSIPEKTPAIVRLQVHQPGEQRILLRTIEDIYIWLSMNK